MFKQKSIVVDIFFSFNPNRVMGINGGYFQAICRVCSQLLSLFVATIKGLRSRLRVRGSLVVKMSDVYPGGQGSNP